jgi:hypothetical protein
MKSDTVRPEHKDDSFSSHLIGKNEKGSPGQPKCYSVDIEKGTDSGWSLRRFCSNEGLAASMSEMEHVCEFLLIDVHNLPIGFITPGIWNPIN